MQFNLTFMDSKTKHCRDLSTQLEIYRSFHQLMPQQQYCGKWHTSSVLSKFSTDKKESANPGTTVWLVVTMAYNDSFHQSSVCCWGGVHLIGCWRSMRGQYDAFVEH